MLNSDENSFPNSDINPVFGKRQNAFITEPDNKPLTGDKWSVNQPGTKGDKGDKGTDGINGTNGADGAMGMTGADGTNGTNGTDGVPGPPGPKDSIIKTEEGIYAFACAEGTQPWFFELLSLNGTPSKRFLASVENESLVTFVAENGQRLVMGIRKGFLNWNMPNKTPEEMKRANNFWNQAS